MPAVDSVQLVRAAIERNKEIPAVLDAYGEFVDSPIGPLELENLGEVFARILDNLAQRYPDAASKRSARTAQTDIAAFLSSTRNDVEVVKGIMKAELESVVPAMAASIAERLQRVSNEERQAIDATLRIIRRSKVEPLFKSDAGKQLSSTDKDFQRYFSLVKAQSPAMRELRYQNLIVEKAIYNKLILKSKDKDYFIWVPSFFAKQRLDELIERNGVRTEHPLLSRLKELDSKGDLQSLEGSLRDLEENLGIASGNYPTQITDFFKTVSEYRVLAPIDLDDISDYFEEKNARRLETLRQEEEKHRVSSEMERLEQERVSQELRLKLQPKAVVPESLQRRITGISENSVYLGKEIDLEQLKGSINARVSEKDILTQSKLVGDYYLELNELAILGSSGTGRSATLKRILDGIGSKPNHRNVVVIDQKGEHRGIAWKFNWAVFAIAKDSQANELRISLHSDTDDRTLLANLIQEWAFQNGIPCSDVQKERIASLLAGVIDKNATLGAISDFLEGEHELSELGQKLKKILVGKGSFSRVFSNTSSLFSLPRGSVLFDISGRGMKDPTTKEERLMITVLLLRDLVARGTENSIIVIEDVLDRFKSSSLKTSTIQMMQKLRWKGNTFIITSRIQCREFLEVNHQELVHRLSGEKVISEEFSGPIVFDSIQILKRMIAMMPRGFLVTSRTSDRPTAAVRVDQLQFAKAS